MDNLGGRLHDSLTLLNRPGRPYVIRSDLTIMPGVTLTIEPGTELEFYPSVGILVLGTLEAQGTIDRSIVMRPVKKSDIKDYRIAQRMGFASNTKYDIEEGGQRTKRSLRLREEKEDFDVRLCQVSTQNLPFLFSSK